MKNLRFIHIPALILLLAAGCNLFSSTSPSKDTTDYMARGQQKYNSGDYSGAVSDFEQAKEADPNNGAAYWWHAKALLRTTGYSTVDLITPFSQINKNSDQIPFMGWTTQSANALFTVLVQVEADLRPLYTRSVNMGDLDTTTVMLDYAVTLAVSGILTLRDTDQNGVIDDRDINLNIHYENGSLTFPIDLWNRLNDNQKNTLINKAEQLLQAFVDAYAAMGQEIRGIGIDDVNDVVVVIISALENLRP